ncbi:hypothetical protein NESM_000053800 [Novymonas esmeraldas]|uniref:EF-hand domain-containing protein n=1 Tax=Novymonas esmeraldas TaxID=1808958 RepID=A0AAW0F4G5_9TRYP
MITTASTTATAAHVAAAPQPRLFDRLDAASKERVTMLLSHYQVLLPVEQASFQQELERYTAEQRAAELARKKAGEHWTRYTTPRLQAVQARDPGYVQQRQIGAPAAASPGADGGAVALVGTVALAPPPPCSLEQLLYTRGMFGEEEGVDIHVSKMSLYDKLRQNMRSRRSTVATSAASTAAPGTPAVVDADAGETQGSLPFAEQADCRPQSAELEDRGVADSTVVTPVAQDVVPPHDLAPTAAAATHTAPVPYRNNAYQAVRLAMNSPGYIAVQQPTSMAAVQSPQDGVRSVLNATAFPISEEELREWFNELDVRGRGVLGVEEFQSYMESLERDLGVPTEYATLGRDGARLARNDRLSFEAFAYLVLRFTRV